MSSVGELIGLERTDNLPHLHPSLAAFPKVDADEYPALAPQVQALRSDIRTVFADAWAKKELEERVQDRHFLDRARDYVELNEQVETSASLLTDLASFLSTFQHDLSAVSGHISELQGRSKTIEGRLAGRKAVERLLHPLVSSIVIPPDLIRIIVDTEVSDAWIPAVSELDAKLGAIRSGPRIDSRKTLDDAAEALRICAAQKILAYFISLLKPFSTAITSSLEDLQSTVLLPSKPLFDFLRRHAARQAHEFQKAYVSTVRWYYETGFRRYVRGLEKMRLRALERSEPIGEAASTNTLDHAEVAGPGVILAFMASDTSFRPPPEALFRSVSLVLMDNAETEHAFIASFFGQHSILTVVTPRPESPTLFSPTPSEPPPRAGGDQDGGESVGGSEAGRASASGSMVSKEERGEKLRRTVIDGLWKSVMEPAQEYARNFVAGLLEPTSPPSPTSLVAMIRLNEAVIGLLVDSQRCPPMEAHLLGLRMQLWPAFSKVMNAQVDSLRRINGAGAAPAGAFAKAISTVASGNTVKDSAVQIIALRYTEMFNTFVALSGEQDDDMVFGSVLRIRQELDRLLVTQASKIPDTQKQRAFLATHYDELLQGLSVRPLSLPAARAVVPQLTHCALPK
ncbi:hypothetical protein RQP46_006541 [Phenoliferia psychrophenolica]